MRLDQYTPPSNHPLHPYVASIWRVESQFSYTRETILPKQNVDLLFNLGAPLHVVCGARTDGTGLADFHIAGPQTMAFSSTPQGNVQLLGVSLKMDGCSAFFSLPLNELTDQTVEGRVIFPQHHFLWEKVAEAQHFGIQCQVLCDWLLRTITPSSHLSLLQHACWSLREQPTSQTLDELATQLNFSSRHLRRLMLQYIGIGPAHYMRLSRFVKSFHLMQEEEISLTDIAHRVNYADQAHFSRDFKEIAGMTPSAYRQRMSHVPGHVFTR